MIDFSAHKKFWLLLIIPIIIFILVLLFLNNGKPINSNAVIDAYKEIDIEQTAKIEHYRDWETDRKSTRLNSSNSAKSRMPSSA